MQSINDPCLIYCGGASFIKPILDLDFDKGLKYLINNPIYLPLEYEFDFCETVEYQKKAIKELSKK